MQHNYQPFLIGANYIEFAPDATTILGSGFKAYTGPSTSAGGAQAIDFDKEKKVAEGEVFYSMPLKNAMSGTYKAESIFGLSEL